MRFRRSMIVGVVFRLPVLLALLMLGGCKKDPEQKTAETKNLAVTLQLNWTPEPEFGGFYAAKHRELYSREGLDVTIQAGAAGVQTWRMVATGQVPFAVASADEVIRARQADASVVALFAVYQTNPHALMVHRASGVTSLGEIFTSGKIDKVAMEAGLPYVHFIKKKFGFGNLDIIQYGGNLSLFLQDPKMAQQCYIFSEPVSAKEQGVDAVAFSVAEGGYNPYMSLVITSESYLAENRAVVEKFVHATRAGWQAYLDDAEPTNEYMKQQKSPMSVTAMKLAAELQKPYVEGDKSSVPYLGYMSKERWEELAGQLVEIGEITSAPDVSRLFVAIP